MKLLDILRISVISFIQFTKKYDLVSRKDSKEYTAISSQSPMVKLIGKNGKIKFVCSSSLKKGDIIEISNGEIIPCDGEIIEGYATVDESAITGESSFVIREAGGDLSKVIGGTKDMCGTIKIKITFSIKPANKKEYPFRASFKI